MNREQAEKVRPGDRLVITSQNRMWVKGQVVVVEDYPGTPGGHPFDEDDDFCVRSEDHSQAGYLRYYYADPLEPGADTSPRLKALREAREFLGAQADPSDVISAARFLLGED